jgi:ribosome-associated toxin RatA of RatAB toxin-antitoxin module
VGAVRLTARVPGRNAADVFGAIQAFERYPELSDSVRTVRVDRMREDEWRSTWEVSFREGVLEWTELDRVDPVALALDFEQIDGDFEQFAGAWRVASAGSGAQVEFSAEFDIGIASLTALIEPVAERQLRENIEQILHGLLGDQVEVTAPQGG